MCAILFIVIVMTSGQTEGQIVLCNLLDASHVTPAITWGSTDLVYIYLINDVINAMTSVVL